MNRLSFRTVALASVLLLAAACSDPESENNANENNANNGGDTGSDVQIDASSDTTDDELTVASVQPTSGSVDGGTSVVISGTGFEQVESVAFGGVEASAFTRISSFQVEATTPAAEQTGTVDVTVTLSSGESANLSDGFRYEESEPQLAVGYCILQFPDSTTSMPGTATESIFGRVFVENCSEGDQRCDDVSGELGWGPTDADPTATPDAFDWQQATYNADHTSDNNDEYQATVTADSAGDYTYAYRFMVDDLDWTYCDLDGTDNGFSTDQMGSLSVETVTIDWCNLQFPESITATVGDTNTVFGQVYVDGCTDESNDCQPVIAELGVAPEGSDASADASVYTWHDAERNPGFTDENNDEFQATLPASTEGSFVYAYRMSGDGGQSWAYCDRDGTDNGFQQDQQGLMTVSSQ